MTKKCLCHNCGEDNTNKVPTKHDENSEYFNCTGCGCSTDIMDEQYC